MGRELSWAKEVSQDGKKQNSGGGGATAFKCAQIALLENELGSPEWQLDPGWNKATTEMKAPR